MMNSEWLHNMFIAAVCIIVRSSQCSRGDLSIFMQKNTQWETASLLLGLSYVNGTQKVYMNERSHTLRMENELRDFLHITSKCSWPNRTSVGVCTDKQQQHQFIEVKSVRHLHLWRSPDITEVSTKTDFRNPPKLLQAGRDLCRLVPERWSWRTQSCFCLKAWWWRRGAAPRVSLLTVLPSEHSHRQGHRVTPQGRWGSAGEPPRFHLSKCPLLCWGHNVFRKWSASKTEEQNVSSVFQGDRALCSSEGLRTARHQRSCDQNRAQNISWSLHQLSLRLHSELLNKWKMLPLNKKAIGNLALSLYLKLQYAYFIFVY